MDTLSRTGSTVARKSRTTQPYRRALLETLEARTLMSVTIVNVSTATFTDVDGDLVTVNVTKGTLNAGLFTMATSGQGEQLQMLDLSSPSFAGANVTISVKQAGSPKGDGLTNVGYIKANGNSLGKVTVAGDLGCLDAGTNTKSGVTSLTVFSMGRQGLASQAGGGNLTSNLTTLGALTVTTDINQAFLNVTGNIGNVRVGGSLIGGTVAGSGSIQSANGSIGNVFVGQDLSASTDSGAASAQGAASILALFGKIGTVTVNGSLLGGTATHSAGIQAGITMGKVAVGGDLQGGSGEFSGGIEAQNIASATVNGSMLGGSNYGSGSILAGILGNMIIGGSVVGGAGVSSGSMISNSGNMGNVTIGGSLVGGAGATSGAVLADSDMGKVVITRDLIGGDANSSVDVDTGFVEADTIASVFVGGSVIAGTNSGIGTLKSGSIRAIFSIGSVTINDGLIGNNTLDAIISAGGPTKGGMAIGSVTVGGRVDHARILAGYEVDLTATRGNVQLGKITVSGDWIASSVLAGVTVGPDTLPGTIDDAVIGGGPSKSSIASIAIAGKVFGTAGAGDNFGFVAGQIASFSAAGVKATLTTGKDTFLVGGTDDVTLHEL